MEKITIEIPTEYENILKKILEMVEQEKSLSADYGSRITFAQENLKATAKIFSFTGGPTSDFREYVGRAAAHCILSLYKMDTFYPSQYEKR